MSVEQFTFQPIIESLYANITGGAAGDRQQQSIVDSFCQLATTIISAEQSYFRSNNEASCIERRSLLKQSIKEGRREIESNHKYGNDLRGDRLAALESDIAGKLIMVEHGILFPYAGEYKNLLETHSTKRHAFYDLLDGDFRFEEMKDSFLSKRQCQVRSNCIAPTLPGSDYLPPLPEEFFFYLYLADSVVRYKRIISKSAGFFIKNDAATKQKQLIKQLAARLANELNHPLIPNHHAEISHKLKQIAKGEPRYSPSVGEPEYEIKKDHPLAIREILTQFMTFEYTRRFALITGKQQRDNSNPIQAYVPRALRYDGIDYRNNAAIDSGHVYTLSDSNIHSQIVADSIAFITGDRDIEARKVAAIKSKLFDNI